MKPAVRLSLVFALLGVGIVTQWLLTWHLEAAGQIEPVSLSRPLTDLPTELGDWRGRDRPIEDERLLYADAQLQRTYMHTKRQQGLLLWIAYSEEGADRGHHPEVCMAVAGQPEDAQARKTCAVPGHPQPVQQYRFGRPGNYQLVYYWHYTFVPPQMEKMDALQRFYQRMRRRPASMTVEVFAPEGASDDGEHATEFVKQVDAALQAHLGPTAVRGSQRTPVTVVTGGT